MEFLWSITGAAPEQRRSNALSPRQRMTGSANQEQQEF